MNSEENILVAQILSSKGLKGEVKIKIYLENYASLLDYQIFDSKNNIYKIQKLQDQGSAVVVKFVGFDDVDAAKELNGTKLYIKKADLPNTLEEEEYYLVDLVGLRVKNTENAEVGKVIAVHNFGAGDVVEVQYQDKKTQLIPFNKQAVPIINIKEGYLVINVIEYYEAENLEQEF
jgi:16S rRNA processing protein RimM